MMASAVRKTFKPTGTLLPSKERMAREKAISVAMGIPKPFCDTVPKLKQK